MDQSTTVSLTMNGAATYGADGGQISLWCMWQGVGATAPAQMMITQSGFV